MSSPVIKLLKSGIIIVALVFVSACGDSTKTDEQHVLDALQLYDKKDVNAAVIELKNALQKNTNNADARALLGRIYAILGDGAAAEKELMRARDMGIPLRDIAIPLGESLLQQSKSDQLIERFQKGTYDTEELKAIKSVLIGEAYLQKQLYTGADKYFELALKNEVTKPRALLGKALVFLMNGDLDGAESLVNEAVSLAATDTKVWMTVADVHLAKNNSNEVLVAYEKVVENSHSNQDYFYWIAMRGIMREYLKMADAPKAEQTFNKLKEAFPHQKVSADLVLTHLRAILVYQQGDYEKAAELANKVLSFQKNHLGSLLLLGTTEAIAERYQQAENMLSRFLLRQPSHLQARKMLAFVQSRNKHPDEAIRTLDPLVKGDSKPDVNTLALIASAAIQAGEVAQSSQYLTRALEQNPENVTLRFALVQSLLAQQNFDMAIHELSKMGGGSDIDLQVKLSMAEAYIKAKEYKAALDVLGELRVMVPDNPMPLSLQGTVHQLMGGMHQAKTMFVTALELDPGYTPATRSLAALAIQTGQVSEAELIYKKALEIEQIDADILFDYAQFLLKQEQLKQAEETIKRLKNYEQYKSQSAVMLARLYLKQRKIGQAVSELKSVDDNANSAIYAELGNAYMDQGEFNNALMSYQKLAEQESSSATAHYLVALALLALNDVDNAEASFTESLKLDENFIPALISMAEIAMAKNDLAVANSKISRINLIDPGNPRVVLLNAKFAMQNNNPQLAATLYGGLYQLQERPALLKSWVQALWKAGQKKEVLVLLDKETVRKPDSSEAFFLKATAYEALGDHSKAVDSYRKVADLEPDNVAALNNLAWLLKDESPKLALKYAKSAYELSPDNLAIKDTLEVIQGLNR